MRRGALMLAMVATACGVPEQLLHVNARVQASGTRDVPVTLESDDGSTSEGCGAFAPLKRIEIPVNASAGFDVLRAETIGPSGSPRCFRLNWNNRSMLAFGPLAHDVSLPAFQVWPSGFDSNADSQERTNDGMRFNTTPVTYLGVAADEYEKLPPRHFVEVVDDRGQVAWRVFEGDPYGGMSIAFNVVSARVNHFMLEGRGGFIRGASFRAGKTYITDSVGRPHTMVFEHRVLTNEVEVFGAGSAYVPPSRGAACKGFDPCPFTDGDFTPAVANVSQIEFDFGGEIVVSSQILVRGLWTNDATAHLRVEYEDPLRGVQRIEVPLGIKEWIQNRNGGYGPGRGDVIIFTNGRTMRGAVVYLVDDAGNPVTITRLAEVSFF